MRESQEQSAAQRYRQSAQRVRLVAELNHNEDVQRTLYGVARECEMLADSLERTADEGLLQGAPQDGNAAIGCPSPPMRDFRYARPHAIGDAVGRFLNRNEPAKIVAELIGTMRELVTRGREGLDFPSRMAVVSMIFACAASSDGALFRMYLP